MSHPFRFGIQAGAPPQGWNVSDAALAWRDLARKVEDLGYSALTVPDHLDDQLHPSVALMAAADATTSLRLGALVYCNDYRHPVVLAKEAATLDVLSGGRLELGIGAGWMTTDYRAAGITMDRPGIRIQRLAEALTVIKGLFGDEPCDFAGAHYRITALNGTPKPTQRPHPPIVIGGGGRQVLTLAARQADIIGLNISLTAGRIDEHAGPTATRESTLEKIGWIRDAAGDRFNDIELQVRIHLAAITDDVPALAEAMGPAFGLTAQQAIDSPHALAGTESQIVETLQRRREELGISYIGLSVDALDAMAPVVARLAGT